ncbi:hypothetical protein HDU76_010869, partial [Blyttiomyces sp. JEL0837]
MCRLSDNEKLKEKFVLAEEVLEVKLKAHGNLRSEALQRDFESAQDALSEKDCTMDGLLVERAQLKEAVGQSREQVASKVVEADSIREAVGKVDKEPNIVRREKDGLLRDLEKQKKMVEDFNGGNVGLAAEQQDAMFAKVKEELEALKSKDTTTITTQIAHKTFTFATQTDHEPISKLLSNLPVPKLPTPQHQHQQQQQPRPKPQATKGHHRKS